MSGLAQRLRGWRSDPRFQRSLSTLLWRGSEHLFRLFSSLVVGLWVARHLQPESYGLLQFALSWVGIFTSLAWMGVGDSLVRDFVRHPNEHGRLLGTAFAIRMTGSCIAALLAVGIAAVFHADNETLLTLIVILSLAIPFAEGPAGISAWFQARGQVHAISLSANAIRVTAAILKITLIVGGIGVIGFAWVSLAEWVAIGVALVLIYAHSRPGLRWRASMGSAVKMVREGLPLALSAIAASINARTDQVMLGWLSDFQQVGVYAAATRFSELWWVIPVIVVNAMAPSYIYADQPPERIRKNVAWIGAGLLCAAVAAAVLTSLLGPWVVTWLLGPSYQAAASILTIHVWLAVFLFVDAPLTQYLLATNRQHFCTAKVVVMLLLNLALNAVFIPVWGAQGAALATLVAMAVANVAVYALLPATRDVTRLQWEMLCVIGRGVLRGKGALGRSA
jgi:polysaccharide transporter, PST family